MELKIKLNNGAEINVITELTPELFLENFSEIRDKIWDAAEDSLPPIPVEEAKDNNLSFDGGKRELFVVITDRITGVSKQYHIENAEIDDKGIVALTLDRGNNVKDTISFPYPSKYTAYHNFKYFVEAAPTKELLDESI